MVSVRWSVQKAAHPTQVPHWLGSCDCLPGTTVSLLQPLLNSLRESHLVKQKCALVSLNIIQKGGLGLRNNSFLAGTVIIVVVRECTHLTFAKTGS